ncbi:MAG: DUF1697 domain-containing protein [Myxococcales bacterium]
MNQYVLLLRGINVGGKNKVPMGELRACLEALGLSAVRTYIASGNVIAASPLPKSAVKKRVEDGLRRRFELDSELIKVHVLTAAELRAVVEKRPRGFGERPGTYLYDAIFLMGVSAAEAMKAFSPREGVDRVWPGDGVIYSQRLSAERTKSRLSKITASPLYQAMTIRNWNTTTRLLAMLDE